MYQSQHQTKGSTFIELLLTLCIVSTMAGIILVQLVPLHEVKGTEYFLEQLSNDLQRFQQYAIVNQKSVHVQFDKYKHHYFAYTDNIYEPIFKRKYPQYIDVNYGTLGNHFIYFPSGNITKSGTIFFYTNRQKYRMVFYLGKGRFYVEKL